MDYGYRPQGVNKQFKNTSALGARRVVVLGPETSAEGVATVRDSETREESRVPLAELGRP